MVGRARPTRLAQGRYPVPSGHAGVYRAEDGKGWEAYVMKPGDLALLGVFKTIKEAAAARAAYWTRQRRKGG